MRLLKLLSLSLLALAPLPAMASSCADQVGTIERRLDSAGAVQVAGLREGHTLRTGSMRAVATAHVDGPSDPDVVPTAEHVAMARTLIERASIEDKAGDQRACEHTMTEAKGMIGALP
jgi:hypothetical protein